MPPRIAEPGAVYVFRLPRGRWGACQAVAKTQRGGEDWVELIALDYLKKRRPTPADAAKRDVLRRDWANGDGSPVRLCATARVPWWAEKIALLTPRATFDDDCHTQGTWHAILGAWYRERWYARENTKRPRGAPIELAIVGDHPSRTDVSYAGADPFFPAFVAQRRFERLRWNVGDATFIDLSRTSLLQLEITTTGPVELLLPSTLQQLTVIGPAHELTAAGANVDFPFRLVIVSPRIVAPPKGLENVQVVTYQDLLDTDSSALSAYARLAELTLRGRPGALTDGRGLACVGSLCELTLQDLYELDTARWPAWLPLVETLTLRGLRKVDADALAPGRWPISAGTVRMSEVRDDAWLEEHVPAALRTRSQ